jgi:acyl-CoA synthetase (AMP-forming)/AMP-acid ligase II
VRAPVATTPADTSSIPGAAGDVETEIEPGHRRAALQRPLVPAEGEVRSVLEALRYQVERDPDAAHIRLLDDQLKPRTLSYADVWTRSRAASGALAESGIRPGDRVALVLPTGKDFFVAFMGILGAGAVPVPIYPPVRMDQLAPYLRRHAAILANAGVRALLTDDLLKAAGGLLRDRVSSLEHVLTVASTARSPGIEVSGTDGDSLGLIQYTSGSTGEPKGVALRHSNLLANIRAIGKGLALNAEDVCVSWLPLYHDMGLIGSWLTALYHGVPIVAISPLQFLARPERWCGPSIGSAEASRRRPTSATSCAAGRIQEHAIEGLDLSSWRVAMNGSEPVLADTVERFCTRFEPHGFRRGTMMPVYGMAENCVALAFPPLGRGPRFDSSIGKGSRPKGGDASFGRAQRPSTCGRRPGARGPCHPRRAA